jgi:hypothetical protein
VHGFNPTNSGGHCTITRAGEKPYALNHGYGEAQQVAHGDICVANLPNEVPIRPPLPKLDRLQPNQEVVLLVDDEGYVVEIGTTDVPAVR